MDDYSGSDFDSLRATPNIDTDACRLLDESGWEEDDKKRGIVAYHYFKAVSKLKGEHAMQLEYNLRVNLKSGTPKSFNVPPCVRIVVT